MAVVRAQFYGRPKEVKAPFREGVGIPRASADEFLAANWDAIMIGCHLEKGQSTDEGTMAHLDERFDEATKQVEAAYQRFDVARSKFKGEMKNDAAAISSGADKIAAQFDKAQKAMLDFQHTLNGPDMAQALANMERIATAMAAINAITPHKIAFAVIENNS